MIKFYLKKIAKNNDKAMFFLKALQFIRNTTILRIDGSMKKYPKVIQLPITYRCNSRCLMCNVWKMDTTDEAEILEQIQEKNADDDPDVQSKISIDLYNNKKLIEQNYNSDKI